MNERLIEDWLAKANERLYQTPFAQSLIAEGMQVLRVAHSPHEHGKDIIAIDQVGKIRAYQLKDGDLDLKEFEKGLGQLIALVETPSRASCIFRAASASALASRFWSDFSSSRGSNPRSQYSLA